MKKKFLHIIFGILIFYIVFHFLYTIYMLLTKPMSGLIWLIILIIELLIVLLGYYKNIIITFIFVLSLLLNTCFSCYIMLSPISFNTSNADYVIVLGYQLNDNLMNKTLQYRLDKAYLYAINNPSSSLVLCGGITGDNSISEASVMADYLIEKGINKKRLKLEDKSTDTIENIKNCLTYVDINANIVLISSQYHIYRAEQICNKLGLNVKTIGAKAPLFLIPNQLLFEKLGLIKMMISI